MIRYWDVFVIAFLTAVVLIPFVRLFAFRFGFLDHPKAHGIHVHPVPRIGGIAIYIAFIVGALYRLDLSEELKGVMVGSSLIFAVGLWDDLFRLRAGFKLLVQLAACAIMMFQYGVILKTFPSGHFINSFFTVLLIIGITNAVNFLDNMDGLSAGLVGVSGFAVFAIAMMTGQTWSAYLALALMGACAGFLVFNLRPAYFFMGDSGSTFLGFTLASLTVMTEWSSHVPVRMAVPVLILGIPIIDMTLITVLRIKENKVRNVKEWIDYTGKDHLSHRVMRLGLTKRMTVFVLWGSQAILCVVAIWTLPQQFLEGILALLFFIFSLVGVIVFFRKRRVLALRLNGRRVKKGA
ncbi:MAG: MraY family glycosyltransferase [Candidatus Omnitrophota bacterium]|jgi:UDP-GlcNAc:undecaprenyl-phosphate GlcNAc-1-phosphate transferase